MTPRASTGLTSPRQARSRQTLERVLVAAEELLRERLFEQLSMAELAERAGVAVGTLYTRFRTKDDLLPVLFERHDASVQGTVVELLADLERRSSLRGRVERVTAFAVEYHQLHRGLLRALTMYVRAHPDSVPARIFGQRAGQYRAVAQALIADGREVRRRDPLAAAEFALSVVNSVCREQVLFDEVTPVRTRGRTAALDRRLCDLVLRDLTA